MRGTRLAAGVALALSLSVVSACGGGDEDASGGPACMKDLTKASVPKDGTFPTDWPFPQGTVVTGTEKAPGGGVAVTAQVGAEFKDVLPFMQHDLEDAGFVATKGEAERDDAEAVWSGNGWTGTWAIKESDSCKGSTLLQVAAVKR